MSSSKHLFEATLNILSDKTGKLLINGIEKAALIQKEVPEKIRLKLEKLQKEIIEESNRLSNNNNESNKNESNNDSTQEKIDKIKRKVSQIAISIENNGI